MSEGLKEMVGGGRMVVEASVRIETDDRDLDLVDVGRMLKEHLEPLSAEVLVLEIVGYGDKDEDDDGE